MRKPGRPRREQAAMDKALAPVGGVRHVVQAMDARGVVLPDIARELERMTEVRVNDETIRRWLKEWRAVEVAT